MKRALKWSGLALLGLLLVAGASARAHVVLQAAFDRVVLRALFLQFALDEPELLTQLRILESVGIRSHNARLTDASPAHDDRTFRRLKDDLATLHRYDASAIHGTGSPFLRHLRLLRRHAGARRAVALSQLSRQPAVRSPERASQPDDAGAAGQRRDRRGALHRAARRVPAQDGSGDRGHQAARKQGHRSSQVRRSRRCSTRSRAFSRPAPAATR